MRKRLTNRHHIIYPSPNHPEQEEVVTIFKGEHFIASKIQQFCRKTVSQGFIKTLKVFIALNEDRAVDLEKKEEE